MSGPREPRSSPPHDGAPGRRPRRPRRQSHPPSHLPAGWRVFFLVSGWLLVLLGVAGLALPGIQGVLTILAGAALLSAASETAYWLLRGAFRRWPRGWRRLERIRRRIYRRLVGAPRPRRPGEQPPDTRGEGRAERGGDP